MPQPRFMQRSSPTARQGKVLLGCLITLGLAIVVAVVATVLIYMNLRNILSSGAKLTYTKIVEALPIDQIERDETLVHLDGLLAKYKNKEISLAEVGMVLESALESPALPAGIVSSAAKLYLEPSSLSDEEKTEGTNQLLRLAHGLHTQQIDPDQINDIFKALEANDQTQSTFTLGVHFDSTGKDEFQICAPDSVTPEQLQEVIAIAKAKADEADLDEAAPQIDFSDEIGKAIDKALAELKAIQDS